MRTSFAKILIIVLSVTVFTIQLKAQKTNVTDTLGRKQGHWVKFDENKKKVYEGNFINDIPDGKFIYFSGTGKPKVITVFSKNGKVGYSKHMNEDGKVVGEGKYMDQKKDSLWKFYDETGKLVSEDMYLNGVKHGRCKVYYSNGKLSQDWVLSNGIPDGICIKYFENGQIKEQTTYVKDKVEGPAKFYYPSGKLSVDGAYKNDFKDGPWTFYNEDGTLNKKLLYVNGKSTTKEKPLMTKEEMEKAKKQYENSEIQQPGKQQ